eukprot:IDg16115t1
MQLQKIFAFLIALTALLVGYAITQCAKIIKKRQRRRRSLNHTQSVHRQYRSFNECTLYLSELQFARTFCMPHHVFFALLSVLDDDLERDDGQARRYSGSRVEPAVRLSVTLRLLASSSYLNLVINYNISPFIICDVFHDIMLHL